MKRKIICMSISLVIVAVIIILIFVKSNNNKYQIESFNSGSTFSQWMQKAIEKTGSSINDLNVTSLDIYLDGSEPSFIDLTAKDGINNKTTEFQIKPNDNTIFKDSIDFQTNEEVPLTRIFECFSVADINNIISAIDSKSVHITSHFPTNKFDVKDVPTDSLIIYEKTIYRDVNDFEIENDAFDYCQFGVAGENESYFIYFLYEPNS